MSYFCDGTPKMAAEDQARMDEEGWGREPKEPAAPEISLEGFEVELRRNRDGIMTVYIDTPAEGEDVQPGGVPRLRVVVNDEPSRLDQGGQWVDEGDDWPF